MPKHAVQEFYERFPFPSKHLQTRKQLFKNAGWVSALVARKPNEFRKGEKVLEAGCGTGEFSAGFALGKALVLGIDLSAVSIKKARELAKRFNLRNVSFRQMDLLKNDLRKESFDFIFSMGVLHHTEKPKEAFGKLAELLKPNGCIVVGLYNKYARLPVLLQSLFLRIIAGKNLQKRIKLANFLFHGSKEITERRGIWLADKYAHPLQKTVSLQEVMQWFKENSIQFMASKPKIEQNALASKMRLLLTQLRWMLGGEGFFTIAGRKQPNSATKEPQK